MPARPRADDRFAWRFARGPATSRNGPPTAQKPKTGTKHAAVDVLDGVRVIDLTMWAFVPAAGGVLAHWGADVIKIEPPGAPDPMRLLGGTLEPGGASWFFKHYSRGKRAVTLDLASDYHARFNAGWKFSSSYNTGSGSPVI